MRVIHNSKFRIHNYDYYFNSEFRIIIQNSEFRIHNYDYRYSTRVKAQIKKFNVQCSKFKGK